MDAVALLASTKASLTGIDILEAELSVVVSLDVEFEVKVVVSLDAIVVTKIIGVVSDEATVLAALEDVEPPATVVVDPAVVVAPATVVVAAVVVVVFSSSPFKASLSAYPPAAPARAPK